MIDTPISDYDAFLRTHGIPLAPSNPGSSEYALRREFALEAVDNLAGTCIAILGGDVVKVESDRLKYVLENWFIEPTLLEPTAEFAERSRDYARRYVEDFGLAEGYEPLFVLVTKDVTVNPRK